MLKTHWTEFCRGCGGAGIQHNCQTGMREKCPVCGGSGKESHSNYDGLPPGVYCMTSNPKIDMIGISSTAV
jgi:DnaJ-class molecular chaperone